MALLDGLADAVNDFVDEYPVLGWSVLTVLAVSLATLIVVVAS